MNTFEHKVETQAKKFNLTISLQLHNPKPKMKVHYFYKSQRPTSSGAYAIGH